MTFAEAVKKVVCRKHLKTLQKNAAEWQERENALFDRHHDGQLCEIGHPQRCLPCKLPFR